MLLSYCQVSRVAKIFSDEQLFSETRMMVTKRVSLLPVHFFEILKPLLYIRKYDWFYN